MKSLNKKAFGGLFFLLIVMGVLLFLPAWTIYFWQAWVFLIVFGLSAFLITFYLMKKDPKLLERRVYAGPTAEKESSQKIIQFITSLGFVGILVVSSLDYRFGWSSASSISLFLIGDALIVFGFIIIFFVFKQNTYASAVIELTRGQKVISTGLYGLVRHPMYMGAFFLLIGIPISLGSLWGFLVIVCMMPALLWRIFDEEKFLTKNLQGYIEYQNKVKYRIIPFIW